MSSQDTTYLNVRETAQRLGVHENTVRNWARDGILEHLRLPGSGYYRFKEEDVERVKRERSSNAPSIREQRMTIGPELVDAKQLDLWASTREAQGMFPELMRRLLAQTPGITGVSVRAHEGVSLSGWDGEADSEGTAFLPVGTLRFEFTVEGNPKKKADRVYQDRRDNPRGIDPAKVTFVFATPRRLSGKDKWAASRRDENVFGDVRVIDADDLEGWLQITPSVHYWLSEQLGRRPRGAETLETWWSRFRSRTVPELPGAFFLAGREDERAQLTQFLSGEPGVLSVRAAWHEEALAFVAGTLETIGNPDAVGAALVVTDEVVWDRFVDHSGPMVLLPRFDNPDIGKAIDQGHLVILPLGKREIVRGPKIDLPRLGRREAAEALQSADIDSSHAHQLAALARRSLRSLVRKLSRDQRLKRPRWAESPDSEISAPLALLGKWTLGEDDLAVVSQMTLTDWERIESKLNSWALWDEPPFVRSGTQWILASPEEAFLVVQEAFTTDALKRWKEIALRVLLEKDPQLDLPRDERLVAEIRGVKRKYSSELRGGIAQASTLLDTVGDRSLADGRTGADHARSLVHEVLDKANADKTGTLWQSLSDILPLLAEAAPTAFLEAVHHDLDRKSPILTTMFQDAEVGSVFSSSSPHSGLLWALETLCWSTETITDACLALSRLQQVDPGGRLGNRPIESLKNVLAGWIWNTSAPSAKRIEIVRTICKRVPDVGWWLVLGLWPRDAASSIPPVSPRFHDWKPESNTVKVSDWLRYVEELVKIAIEQADVLPERLVELAERVESLPAQGRDRVLAHIEDAVDNGAFSSEERLLLWEGLHKTAARHRRFQDAGWALDERAISRLEVIASRLHPSDRVERFAYLFDSMPDLPGVDMRDFKTYDAELNRRRIVAVETVLSEASIEGVKQIAARCSALSDLGATLGTVASEEMTPQLLKWLDAKEEALSQVARSWAAQKLHSGGVPWLENALSRPEMASTDSRLALALVAPGKREVWEALTEHDAGLMTQYWKQVRPLHVAQEQAEYATRQFLQHDRPWAAIKLLSYAKHRGAQEAGISVDLAKEALEAASEAELEDGVFESLGYEVGQLLAYLREEGVEDGVIARYEFVFFRLLEHHYAPRSLFAALGSDPSLFVDLVSRVFRGQNESKRRVSERDQGLARHAWWVLQEWRQVPGESQDGSIDADRLFEWIRAARLAFAELDREDVGDEQIGQVLAASPAGTDGVWPAEAVREVIEDIGNQHIENGFDMAVFNDRGVNSRGIFEGGEQERELAQQYREWSRQLEAEYPRTSRLLRRIAESYRHFARKMDEEAEILSDD